MMGLFEFIRQQILHNQFAAAAFIAAPAGIIAYSLRKIPTTLYVLFKKMIFINVTVKSGDGIFLDTLIFLSDNVINEKFSKSFRMTVPYTYTKFTKGRVPVDITEGKSGKIIGYGFHHGWYKGRYVGVNYYYKQDDQSDNYKEICQLYFLGFKRSLVSDMAKDVFVYAESSKTKSKLISVYVNSAKEWTKMSSIPQRPMKSIFLPGNTSNKILEHINKWESKKEWNRDRGLPTNTGIILYGPPGTSKTSLIHATATETGRSIYYLNLSAIASESQITELLSAEIDWNTAILVIEDVDATSVNVSNRNTTETKEGSKVSLSTLLNFLDGIMTPPDMLVMATTNHYENIDPALLRPGRFDLSLEVGRIGYNEFVSMATFFEKDIEDYSEETFVPMTGAEARTILINR